MDEFAIVKDDEMVIYLVSDQTPRHSSLDKSSTLLDFTVVSTCIQYRKYRIIAFNLFSGLD